MGAMPYEPPTHTVERSLRATTGAKIVAGVDEVGRGAWAGPVTVCAAITGLRRPPAGLTDSKLLTAANRERLHDEIVARAFAALDAADGDVDGRIDHAKIAQQMAEMRDVRLALIDAQRRELLRIRDLGTASSSALNRMLARLDADQIGLELRDPSR